MLRVTETIVVARHPTAAGCPGGQDEVKRMAQEDETCCAFRGHGSNREHERFQWQGDSSAILSL
jgi:hypothetical protein